MSAINERVSPKRLAEIIARAEVCDDSVLTDYRDIESIARELQQYRAAAEPVVYIGKQMLESLCDEGGRICGRVWRSNTDELSGESRIPLYASPQVTSVPDDAFERALSVLNDTLDDCGDSERGLLLALDRMGIEVAGAAPAVQAEQLSGNTEQAIGDAFISEFERLIHERDSEIDAGQLGSYNYTALLKAASDAFATVTGNSPAIPDGYALVPIKLTAENGAKGLLSGEFSETKFISCPECFGDDECETCDGSGRIEITVPVSWTTIKEIWAKGVAHFAAAPQQEAE